MPCPLVAHAAHPRRLCRLLWAVAPAYQHGVCDYRTSNVSRQTVKTVRPFTTPSTSLLRPRLTSAATSPRLSTRLARGHRSRSLRVRRVTFLPYTRRIYAGPDPMPLDFESLGPLAQPADASYAIRVPRARSLPTASFRFRLAADTLAVRLGVPVIKASIGTFTRQVTSRFAFALRLPAPGHDAARHA